MLGKETGKVVMIPRVIGVRAARAGVTQPSQVVNEYLTMQSNSGGLTSASALWQLDSRVMIRGRHAIGNMDKSLTQVPLLELTNGFMSFKTFAAAIELEVFTRLAGGRSVTVEQCADELGIAPRPAGILLAACASLGLLEKTGDGYRNSPLAERFLVAGQPHYFGGFVRFYDQLYPGWHNVVQALRTNRPIMWDAAERDTAFSADDSMMMETFWEAMHSLAGSTAQALAEVYDFGQHRRLLDVGGGSGGFPIELCQRFLGLSATVYELEHVCPIAEQKIKAAGLSERISTVAGDFKADAGLPGGHDVILLSQILHGEGEATNRALLAKCFDALRPGGMLLICELLLNPERTGPPAAALMGMNMLVGQLDGRNYAATEYLSWLRDTGFTGPEVLRFDAAGANGAVVARKGPE